MAAAWIWGDVPLAGVLLTLLAVAVHFGEPVDRFVVLRSLVFRGLFFGLALQTWRVLRSDEMFSVGRALWVGAVFAVLLFGLERITLKRRGAEPMPKPPIGARADGEHPRPSPTPPS